MVFINHKPQAASRKVITFSILLLLFLPPVFADEANSSLPYVQVDTLLLKTELNKSPNISIKFSNDNYSVSVGGIARTTDGNYFVGGNIFDDAGPKTWSWVTKIEKDGHKQWQREFGKNHLDTEINSAAATDNEAGAILGGASDVFSGTSEAATSWLFKLDSKGQVTWEKHLLLSQVAIITDVKSLPDRNIVIAVRSRSGEERTSFIVLVNIKGDIVWKKQIKEEGGVFVDHIYPLRDGSLVLGGEYWKSNLLYPWVARINLNGDMIWAHRFNDNKVGKVSAITEVLDNEILLGINSNDVSDKSAWLITLDSEGKEKWHQDLNKKILCRIVNFIPLMTSTANVIGQTCEKDIDSISLATVSSEGKILASKKIKVVDGFELKEALAGPDGKLIIVGNSNRENSVSDSWLLLLSP